LDRARDSGLKAVNGRLVHESNISIRHYPGRSLAVESPNGGAQGSLITNNVYLVGKRLYSLQVGIPRNDQPGSKESDRLNGAATKFLDSFDILNGRS
jgi:hypothetical protein